MRRSTGNRLGSQRNLAKQGVKLLVFEYACAGGEAGKPFLKDGRKMLTALLRDLHKLRIAHITTLRSATLGIDLLFAHKVVTVKGDLTQAFIEELQNNDAVWIIAPETGQKLFEFTRIAEDMRKTVFGSSSEAVEICGDKLKTYETLSGFVITPHTAPFIGNFPYFPSVVKPRDGAGCDSVFYCTDEHEDLPLHPGKKFVVQAFVKGTAMSAGIISDKSRSVLLGFSRQILEKGRVLRFNGLDGPVEYSKKDKMEAMIKIIKEKIPGLSGYWGVDFVDTDNGPVLIEVNPRLTLSYSLYSPNIPFQMVFPK
jgi:predicted ATP-grasp superfamily ATP-dependent carboligase